LSIVPGTILVIDDEPAIRRFLRTTLTAQGWNVVEAGTGEQGLTQVAHHRPDLVILDLGLPGIDGQGVIERLRPEHTMPIIILSSRDDETAKVLALDSGADDFITKPFGIDELMARMRAALRHAVQAQGGRPVYDSGGLHIDLVKREIRRDGTEVKLSPREYDVLAELAAHAGKVLTHNHLLKKIWGQSAGADATNLRVHVRQLRAKIEPDPARPAFVVTEPGVGYRLRAPE